MPLMTDWTSATGEVLLHFSDAVMAVFRANVQTSGRSEAGGILLGTVHANGMLITHATVPSRFDQRLPTFFSRSARGHRAVAQRLWRASGGTTRYLGDWHTHPEDVPSPSGIDLREWRKLALARNDERPALSVIVGRLALHVELVHSSGDRDQLASVI
jgi:integrative and conjugative element protein (TIGR02256 family)